LQGVHGVVSLLEPGEAADLDLQEEASEARAHGLKFVSFPIHDRSIPDSEARFQDLVDELGRELSSGRNIVLHCRQGVGRTGLVAAGLLLSQAMSVDSAVKLLTSVRGVSIPETVEQLRWLEHYAVNLEPAR
jgi:protein-tyrosine phosphatase